MELERLARAKRIVELLRERKDAQDRLKEVNDELQALNLTAQEIEEERDLFEQVRAILNG